MILDIVESINGVPIRLTDERWYEHIVNKRPRMSGYRQAVLDTVSDPEFILRGTEGSKVAILNTGRNQWLHVFYIELNQDDGFIISAYIKNSFNRNQIIWRREF